MRREEAGPAASVPRSAGGVLSPQRHRPQCAFRILRTQERAAPVVTGSFGCQEAAALARMSVESRWTSMTVAVDISKLVAGKLLKGS